ncbi:MAG: CvpA family protein [Clostridiales bacterium]|nr:CvpA family protein [Clostridiales bacterium]
MPYLFDIAIIALLALFAWRGAAKGLMLSLCGLAAVFVAFFAAQFVSEQFCAPVGSILRPIIIQTVRGAGAEPAAADSETSYTADELLASIQEKGLYKGFHDFLEEGIANDTVGHSSLSPLDSLVRYLAQGVAKMLLFGITFIGILLIWFLVSHALDLAFKLPILAEVNLAGGLLIGLVKGALIAVVLVWLGQVAGIVPRPPETPVLSLFTVQRLWELLHSLPA